MGLMKSSEDKRLSQEVRPERGLKKHLSDDVSSCFSSLSVSLCVLTPHLSISDVIIGTTPAESPMDPA